MEMGRWTPGTEQLSGELGATRIYNCELTGETVKRLHEQPDYDYVRGS